MNIEQFRWLAGIIAAHPNRTVKGRTRLQKTVMLLQNLDFPTNYLYSIHFYGPYSDGVSSDARLLESLGLVVETSDETPEGTRYIMTAVKEAELEEMKDFSQLIAIMQEASQITLELAATYAAFHKMHQGSEKAMERFKYKKAKKINPESLRQTKKLLEDLGLPSFELPAPTQ